jgi:hypothetical protein
LSYAACSGGADGVSQQLQLHQTVVALEAFFDGGGTNVANAVVG